MEIATADWMSLDARALNQTYAKTRQGLRSTIIAAKALPVDPADGDLSPAILSSLIVKAGTVLAISPLPGAKAGWDVGSVASVTRDMADAYLALLYLQVDPVSPEEWDARWRAFLAHDNHMQRCQLSEADRDQYDETRAMLDAEAAGNPILSALPDHERSAILDGSKAPHIDGDMLRRVIADDTYFVASYRFVRSHARCSPVSLLTRSYLGTGDETKAAKRLIGMALHFAARILLDAVERVSALRPA